MLMGDYSDHDEGFIPLTCHTKRCAFAAGLAPARHRHHPLLARRDHDSRPALLCRAGLARWYAVGSATIDLHESQREDAGDSTHSRFQPRPEFLGAATVVWSRRAMRVLAIVADRRSARWRCSTPASRSSGRSRSRRCTRSCGRTISAASCARSNAPRRRRRAAGAREPRRRAPPIAFLARELERRAGRRAGRAHPHPADRRELRRRQRHRHRRTARAARASTRKPASPASPGRPRSPGTARPISRRSATSTRCGRATTSC